jgi:hypothetical protein
MPTRLLVRSESAAQDAIEYGGEFEYEYELDGGAKAERSFAGQAGAASSTRMVVKQGDWCDA